MALIALSLLGQMSWMNNSHATFPLLKEENEKIYLFVNGLVLLVDILVIEIEMRHRIFWMKVWEFCLHKEKNMDKNINTGRALSVGVEDVRPSRDVQSLLIPESTTFRCGEYVNVEQDYIIFVCMEKNWRIKYVYQKR